MNSMAKVERVSSVVTIIDDDDTLDAMTTEELLALLVQVSTVSARVLCAWAKIWKKIEKRGVKLDKYRKGLLRLVYLIAEDEIDPGAVECFYSSRVMDKVVSLPVADQRRLVANPSLPVVERARDGTWTTRLIDVMNMEDAQVRQVFCRGEIRNEARQIAYLTQQAPPWRPGKVIKVGNVKVDRNGAGTVIVGRVQMSLADLVEALRKAGVSV